jgi:hypothetical protein
MNPIPRVKLAEVISGVQCNKHPVFQMYYESYVNLASLKDIVATSESGNADSGVANAFGPSKPQFPSFESHQENFLNILPEAEFPADEFASYSVLCRSLRATPAGCVECNQQSKMTAWRDSIHVSPPSPSSTLGGVMRKLTLKGRHGVLSVLLSFESLSTGG